MKKSLLTTFFLSFLVALLLPIQPAQAEGTKIGIFVSHSRDDDPVADRVVYKFKEEIRKSLALRLVTEKTQSDIVVAIVSIPGDDSKAATYMSVAWLLQSKRKDPVFDAYLNQSIRSCGSKVTGQCAESLAAVTDEIASKWAWLFDSSGAK
ncbi:hypothetical protein ABRZ04_05315 [Castellaniella ginsengisoli]|uniref:TPM domain-containing protein n=1 Tax=Castellaniella ginsengisoli TaxID=546114 RepID=A0AB39D2Q0_9BURK